MAEHLGKHVPTSHSGAGGLTNGAYIKRVRHRRTPLEVSFLRNKHISWINMVLRNYVGLFALVVICFVVQNM